MFWFITKWAETANVAVAVAMVAPPEMISIDKLGITVATNRGMQSEIFTNQADAINWIRFELNV